MAVCAFVIPLVITVKFGAGNDTDIGTFVVAVIPGIPAGLSLSIVCGSIVAALLHMNENLRLLVELNGGEPVEQFPET
jgi:hypothetical protein